MPAAGFRLEKDSGRRDQEPRYWRPAYFEFMEACERNGRTRQRAIPRVEGPAAVFSMGGYVAGPPVLAALLRGVPVVVMEPERSAAGALRTVGSPVG